MTNRLIRWLNKNYPQNLIIEKPVAGIIFFLSFCFVFVILYQPLDLHGTRYWGFEVSMIIYLIALAIPLYILIRLLGRIKYFSNPNEWTLFKELVSIIIILSGMGIAIYFYGFLLEEPGSRWNMSTFFDSYEHSFLIGLVPFMFFTVINYRHLMTKDIERSYISVSPTKSDSGLLEKQIRIGSQLKKEELIIYPSELVYAESEGNYVVFYLTVSHQIQRKVIRNSINNIENQLSSVPFLLRTHRAFIVNVRYVISQKGNTLGYRLHLKGVDSVVPVSRQNVKEFDHRLKQLV
jgi:hypothetical protein